MKLSPSDLWIALVRSARRPVFWLVLLLSITIGRGLLYYDFVPMWDAMDYGRCIAGMALGSFQFRFLNCFEHPSAAYFFAVALPNRLFGLHYGWVIFVNLALGGAAVLAFYDMLRRLIPGKRYAPEILCLTAMLACHPLVMANAVSVNPDYGVYCFFVLFLNGLLKRKTLQPVLWGVCLAFSKEMGILLYGTSVAVQFVSDLIRRRYGLGQLLLRAAAFAIPPAVLGYFLLERASSTTQALWYGVTPKQIIYDSLLHFDATDPTFRTYLGEITILQFSWVLVAILVLGWIARALRLAGRLFARPSAIPGGGLFSSVLLLGVVFFLTRFKTTSNARYFLAVVPVLLWASYESLRALTGSRRVRLGVLGTLAVVFLVSNYRTIDPVSKGVFGTFDFGTHPVLGLAAYGNECCCKARDQLVYNLEHVHLHYLEEEVFQDLKPQLQAGQPIVVYPQSDWHNIGPVRTTTMRRALGSSLTAELNIIDEPNPDIVASRVKHGYFLALPNCENPGFLARLQVLFQMKKVKAYERDGYAIDLFELDRKG